jgi:hypothetical protein
MATVCEPVLLKKPKQGQVQINSQTGAFRYVPPAQFQGTVTFLYGVFDGIEFGAAEKVTIVVG